MDANHTETSALVIIDVQNEFISTAGAFPISDVCRTDLITNLTTLIPQFRKTGHIIWIKAVYGERTEEPSCMQEHPRGDGILGSNEWLAAATHVHPTPCCKAGSFGADIYPDVFALAEPEDMVITKDSYSAFSGTSGFRFLDALRERNVTDVYFCGVASGTCVLATVVDAVMVDGLQVHVVLNCMGWRRLNTHQEAIRRFKALHVNLTNSNDAGELECAAESC
ncbi:putative inactive nicotinamidase [Lachnellula hyalina]|uniref:Putative inactive nicotinamidase n=1 Tax=Lachnellula hyalina TaxID=1316788 RepID=A0A8H8TZA7_9HELO|nr:putative inactive nicotinamidase [Lachnellula hyalina]TVY24776.1 putative inactive nicotinamidase [Lachnellula hyalina]